MSKKTLKIAFVADPLSHFDTQHETTFFIMDELSKRNHNVYHFELKDLFLHNTSPRAAVQKIKVTKVAGKFTYNIINHEELNIADFDVVFLRKDPPVDLNFIDHLSLLELAAGDTLMVNHPTWIKHANEKLFTFHFQDLTPRTLVSQDIKRLSQFVKTEKKAILKPLNLAGGRGVMLVEGNNPSLSSMLDILTERGTRYIMAQQYLPEAQNGDKRILLLDGEVLGAFLRVPGADDFRGNLHSGAKLQKTALTKREEDIVKAIGPKLKKLGLYFVGLDLIGDYVTEINSTSPMGVGEINTLQNCATEAKIVDWLENKFS